MSLGRRITGDIPRTGRGAFAAVAGRFLRGAGGVCAALLGLVASEAAAHPTTGFAKLHADEASFETRITLAISALSELAVLDPNADGTVTRGEIAASLPLVRQKLLELLDLKLNGDRSPVGEVVNVETLWPREREAGLLGGISLEASYLDITFACTAPAAVHSYTLDFGPLFKVVTSLSGIEATCSMEGQPKQTFLLSAVNTLAVLERPPPAVPASPPPVPVGDSEAGTGATTPTSAYVWLVLLLMVAATVAAYVVWRTRAKARAQTPP